MARDDLHFRLRIPEELKKRIQEAADASKRSMTAEIVARLEQSFFRKADPVDETALDIISSLVPYVRWLHAISKKMSPLELFELVPAGERGELLEELYEQLGEGGAAARLLEDASDDASSRRSQGPVDAPLVRAGRNMKAASEAAAEPDVAEPKVNPPSKKRYVKRPR